MVKTILLTILCTIYTSLIAQTTAINLSLYKEKIRIKGSIKARVLSDGKFTILTTKDSLLYIPDSFLNRKLDLEITTNKYKLKFDSLYFYWREEYPFWKIDIDFFPFDKKKHWAVKEKLKKVKWIFSIDRGNGTIIEYYGRKSLMK